MVVISNLSFPVIVLKPRKQKPGFQMPILKQAFHIVKKSNLLMILKVNLVIPTSYHFRWLTQTPTAWKRGLGVTRLSDYSVINKNVCFFFFLNINFLTSRL